MFILRQITKDGKGNNELNHVLGDYYTIVKKENDEDEFNYLLGNTNHHPDAKNIYAILMHSKDGNNEGSYPLYDNQYYYIMTESGKTFANITYK